MREKKATGNCEPRSYGHKQPTEALPHMQAALGTALTMTDKDVFAN